MKTSAEIRSDFLQFFREKHHTIVRSSPIVAHGDPTLKFINAGMNQFKDVFLGTGSRNYTRAANTQKCLRVSGKHNDLDVVGRDTYHHTFFEMLGNWSFGDYFKKEAITWAWELITEVYKIPKEKLWATVFAGDKEDGLPKDEEAENIWLKETDIDKNQVLRFGKKDNFWEMGDTGPCGPCSEIHIDLGPDACDHKHIDGHICSVNCGCSRFIEIWNLVFMQFNRTDDGKLHTLPSKHVDTGMGFERLVAILQQKPSNYDTDLFTPILSELSRLTGLKYTHSNNSVDVAFRVIADHVKALSMTFADGALPGRSDRGYVLRRILRRASRFGRQGLGMEEPFIYKLVATVAHVYEEIFPEIKQRQKHIELLIKTEEESFGKTIGTGIQIFTNLVKELKEENKNVIPGEKAYRLYHQDGFPQDLIELMAEEENMKVDIEGWKKAEQKHKEESKGEQGKYQVDPSVIEGLIPTRFAGYSKLESTANIVKMIDSDKIVLDVTPFYAESGGQVGDTGIISGKSFKFKVLDTQKFGDIIVHFGETIERDMTRDPSCVTAYVDRNRRRKIMANHTATHLLHWALRKVLGEHATQQGSIVLPEKLRFDVAHPQKITQEQLQEIERLVNQKISDNIKIRKGIEPLEVAKKKGAIALFGEKYGDKVRVVNIGRYSKELCGGIHAYFTGDLGYFKILSESSVQAGVRRIEATTREEAVENVQKQLEILDEIKKQLKIGDLNAISSRINTMQEEIKNLKKKGSQKAQKDSKEYAEQIVAKATETQGVKVVISKVDSMPANELRALGDMIRKSSHKTLGVLVSVFKEKVFVVAFVSDKMLPEKKVHAGEIIKTIGPIIGGGGDPRREDFSLGQGPKVSEVDIMMDKVTSIIQEKLLQNG